MGTFKNFILRQALKRKMKDLPAAQRDKLLSAIEKNPDFFKKIGDEVEKRKKSGQDETVATMQVMREHQAELQKIMMQ